jgi:hypothetical protein
MESFQVQAEGIADSVSSAALVEARPIRKSILQLKENRQLSTRSLNCRELDLQFCGFVDGDLALIK